MKKSIKISLLYLIVAIVFVNCEKSGDKSNIIYRSIDKNIVLIRDVQTVLESNDDISNHVDSILSGLINSEFISTGAKNIDLDRDEIFDVGFEIIDLNKFNPNGLPEYLDSLAARVLPLSVEILDNTTYGYPDALDLNEQISGNGNWSKKNCVLGTFANAGQFQGKGEKYLGFRFTKNNGFKYGWIKIYCSQHSDTLRILDFAYNNIVNSNIKAGQIE